jgi:hypothetical protein
MSGDLRLKVVAGGIAELRPVLSPSMAVGHDREQTALCGAVAEIFAQRHLLRPRSAFDDRPDLAE